MVSPFFIKRSVLFVIILGIFGACGKENNRKKYNALSDVPVFTPNQMMSIDHAGDIYFGHLGYSSAVLNDGDIMIPDRHSQSIVVVNKEGEFQHKIPDGRGPGEILDAYNFTKSGDGAVFVNDQGNKKILEFDAQGYFKSEFVTPAYEAANVSWVYPTGEDEFIFEMSSHAFMTDVNREREIILISYNREKEEYGEVLKLLAQPYARLVIDGRVGGAALVPYSLGNLTAFNRDNETIFTYDTGTNIIAEITSDFDTLRTIPVNLPTEKISSAEIDSMKTNYRPEQWRTIKELLPETKAPVQKMICANQQIWLKSNLKGETEKWFVVNLKGQVIKVVDLPKGSMLMHISEKHLGVRLNDVTFSLFENPKLEPLN